MRIIVTSFLPLHFFVSVYLPLESVKLIKEFRVESFHLSQQVHADLEMHFFLKCLK